MERLVTAHVRDVRARSPKPKLKFVDLHPAILSFFCISSRSFMLVRVSLFFLTFVVTTSMASCIVSNRRVTIRAMVCAVSIVASSLSMMLYEDEEDNRGALIPACLMLVLLMGSVQRHLRWCFTHGLPSGVTQTCYA